MPTTIDPLVPSEHVRGAAISELWKAQHALLVAVQALKACTAVAATNPLLHRAALPLLTSAVALHNDTVGLRQAVEQS